METLGDRSPLNNILRRSFPLSRKLIEWKPRGVPSRPSSRTLFPLSRKLIEWKREFRLSHFFLLVTFLLVGN